MPEQGGYLTRPAPSGLADVVDIVLAKGIVIDAYVRVSLLGIELLTLDTRMVVASVDTYLRFAEATNRLDLWEQGGRTLPDLMAEGAGEAVEAVATDVVEGKVSGAVEKVGEKLGGRAEEVTKSVGRKALGAVERVAEHSGLHEE